MLMVPLTAGAAEANQWKGLKLDASTQGEAIATLGDPTESEHAQKIRTPVDILLDKKLRFERLVCKKGEAFDRADLYFRDGKLVAILIDLKEQVKAAALGSVYNLEFEPKASVVERGSFGRDYERHKGKVYPRNFPTVYELVADAPTSWVAAYIGNSGFGSAMRTLGGLADDSMGFPGKCYRIWLISKSLRDATGVEALK